jgi:hypothetical protein
LYILVDGRWIDDILKDVEFYPLEIDTKASRLVYAAQDDRSSDETERLVGYAARRRNQAESSPFYKPANVNMELYEVLGQALRQFEPTMVHGRSIKEILSTAKPRASAVIPCSNRLILPLQYVARRKIAIAKRSRFPHQPSKFAKSSA